ncbi:MAG TPA: leucine--tRNA ligase [Candidatus Paceibacterota bacterium]
MKEYDHKKIEKKWQKVWEKEKFWQAKNKSKQPKFYGLIEFPYPSGQGLHVGHIRSNTAMDIICRKRRMEGFNVLYPIGWDAFGLPTENYAVKTGIQPAIVTKKNTDIFRKQLKSLGFSFDWSREINTSSPEYYKWTQWIFLKLFEKGLAYKKKIPINWCLSCKIGLANEEVVDGKCERCGGPTEKREKEQWMLAITKYADRLDKDLDEVDYLEEIKTQQRNWIGKSNGSLIKFQIASHKSKVDQFGTGKFIIEVFTTRVDTLFGATYLVLSPEHLEIQKYKSQITNWEEVEKYISEARKKTEIERTAEIKDTSTGSVLGKTGVELNGIKAVNPANGEEIPVWVADYVLADYGTGAIMAVPAHDERDFQFAKKYNLPITEVITGGKVFEEAYLGEGKLINSSKFDGMESKLAAKVITEFVEGKITTKYKLRDWVFSRQRYWGEPIPLIFCEKDGWVAVPEKDLPVKLPKVKDFKPNESGESPLAQVTKWLNVKCPKCDEPTKRETDTMPNWAGSSWYYLRYIDPKNKKEFANKKKMEYWLGTDPVVGGVNWYNGGMEHVTLHLLYSRFWHKFLFDLKLVPTNEPYKKRTAHGLILAEGGVKMSKSKGNVINPDEIVKRFGADSLRVYEMFMGPFDQAINWNTDGVVGAKRFLEKVWRIGVKFQVQTSKSKTNSKFQFLINQTIKKVTEDIETMRFNTAISTLMILTNEMDKLEKVTKEDFEILLRLLAPFAPHITEELWSGKKSIHLRPWPKYDQTKIQDKTVKIVIQINGKVRGILEISRDLAQTKVEKQAAALPEIAKWLVGKSVKKIIFVPARLLNFVVA